MEEQARALLLHLGELYLASRKNEFLYRDYAGYGPDALRELVLRGFVDRHNDLRATISFTPKMLATLE